LKHGYEIAQDPTEWDAEQKEINEERENAANQVDELEDDDEEADTSATKRKKATKEKSKKRAKVSKVSFCYFHFWKYEQGRSGPARSEVDWRMKHGEVEDGCRMRFTYSTRLLSRNTGISLTNRPRSRMRRTHPHPRPLKPRPTSPRSPLPRLKPLPLMTVCARIVVFAHQLIH
jgi:anaerobic selenocysteine-containing dehydrogenase